MTENDTITWGVCRRMIRHGRRREGVSRVNPGLTHQQALDILEAAIKDRPDDGLVSADVRGDLMLRNIQRECGVRATD